MSMLIFILMIPDGGGGGEWGLAKEYNVIYWGWGVEAGWKHESLKVQKPELRGCTCRV